MSSYYITRDICTFSTNLQAVKFTDLLVTQLFRLCYSDFISNCIRISADAEIIIKTKGVEQQVEISSNNISVCDAN